MDLDRYRVSAEALARALNATHHARHTGRSGADDTAALVGAAAGGIVDPDAITALLDGGHRRLARFAVEARVTARVVGRRPAVRVELVRAEARLLGWPSARAMWAQLSAVDLDALVVAAQQAVAAAPPPLSSPSNVATSGTAPEATTFVAPDAAEVIEALAEIGVGVEEVPGLTRAFTAALDVPGDVRVVVAPGVPIGVLLHEAGHAALLASRDPAAPFEDRYLLDRAQTEATAYAFETLGGSPDPHRPGRLAAGLLADLALLDHGPVTELVGHLERADPLLHRADYFSALSTAPRTDLRFALRAS